MPPRKKPKVIRDETGEERHGHLLKATNQFMHPLQIRCNNLVAEVLGGHTSASNVIHVRCLCNKEHRHESKEGTTTTITFTCVFDLESWVFNHACQDKRYHDLPDEDIDEECFKLCTVEAPGTPQHGVALREFCKATTKRLGHEMLAGSIIWIYWWDEPRTGAAKEHIKNGDACFMPTTQNEVGVWYKAQVITYNHDNAELQVIYTSDKSKHQLLIPLAMVHWGEEAPKSASSIIKEPPPTPLPPAPHTPDLNLQLLTDWQNRPLPQAGAAKQHKEEKSKHKDRSKASKEKGKDGGGTATTAGVEAARVPGHKDQAGVKATKKRAREPTEDKGTGPPTAKARAATTPPGQAEPTKAGAPTAPATKAAPAPPSEVLPDQAPSKAAPPGNVPAQVSENEAGACKAAGGSGDDQAPASNTAGAPPPTQGLVLPPMSNRPSKPAAKGTRPAPPGTRVQAPVAPEAGEGGAAAPVAPATTQPGEAAGAAPADDQGGPDGKPPASAHARTIEDVAAPPQPATTALAPGAQPEAQAVTEAEQQPGPPPETPAPVASPEHESFITAQEEAHEEAAGEEVMSEPPEQPLEPAQEPGAHPEMPAHAAAVPDELPSPSAAEHQPGQQAPSATPAEPDSAAASEEAAGVGGEAAATTADVSPGSLQAAPQQESAAEGDGSSPAGLKPATEKLPSPPAAQPPSAQQEAVGKSGKATEVAGKSSEKGNKTERSDKGEKGASGKEGRQAAGKASPKTNAAAAGPSTGAGPKGAGQQPSKRANSHLDDFDSLQDSPQPKPPAPVVLQQKQPPGVSTILGSIGAAGRAPSVARLPPGGASSATAGAAAVTVFQPPTTAAEAPGPVPAPGASEPAAGQGTASIAGSSNVGVVITQQQVPNQQQQQQKSIKLAEKAEERLDPVSKAWRDIALLSGVPHDQLIGLASLLAASRVAAGREFQALPNAVMPEVMLQLDLVSCCDAGAAHAPAHMTFNAAEPQPQQQLVIRQPPGEPEQGGSQMQKPSPDLTPALVPVPPYHHTLLAPLLCHASAAAQVSGLEAALHSALTAYHASLPGTSAASDMIREGFISRGLITCLMLQGGRLPAPRLHDQMHPAWLEARASPRDTAEVVLGGGSCQPHSPAEAAQGPGTGTGEQPAQQALQNAVAASDAASNQHQSLMLSGADPGSSANLGLDSIGASIKLLVLEKAYSREWYAQFEKAAKEDQGYEQFSGTTFTAGPWQLQLFRPVTAQQQQQQSDGSPQHSCTKGLVRVTLDCGPCLPPPPLAGQASGNIPLQQQQQQQQQQAPKVMKPVSAALCLLHLGLCASRALAAVEQERAAGGGQMQAAEPGSTQGNGSTQAEGVLATAAAAAASKAREEAALHLLQCMRACRVLAEAGV